MTRGRKRSTETLLEKLRRYAPEGPAAECWPWNGARDPYGYGQFWDHYQRRVIQAPRVAWELARGPIPDGMKVLHTCDTPPCVNPAHLFLGTDADNVRDAIAKGRRRHRASPRRLQPGALRPTPEAPGVGAAFPQRTEA